MPSDVIKITGNLKDEEEEIRELGMFGIWVGNVYSIPPLNTSRSLLPLSLQRTSEAA